MALYFLVSGLGAWFAAFTLAREGYQLALNGTTPSCNINPFFSCGSVMQSPQATLFFDTPNQLFGVAGYIAVAMVGAAMLSGATLRRTFWVVFTLGILSRLHLADVDVCPGSFCHRLLMPLLHGGVGNPHPPVVDFLAVGHEAGNAELLTSRQESGSPVAALQLGHGRHQLRRDYDFHSDSVPVAVLCVS